MKLNLMRSIIIHILDFFYPIVRRFIPKETYYYAACGGGNLVLSWFLFFFFYQIVFQKEVTHYYISWLGYKHVAISAHTYSSLATFLISFTIGFLLNRYVVFTKSELKGYIQLFRYGLSACITYFLGWILLKLFVESLMIFPSIANILSSCIIVVFSYIMQRKFTFK
jgi:putative flippase GtrA